MLRTLGLTAYLILATFSMSMLIDLQPGDRTSHPMGLVIAWPLAWLCTLAAIVTAFLTAFYAARTARSGNDVFAARLLCACGIVASAPLGWLHATAVQPAIRSGLTEGLVAVPGLFFIGFPSIAACLGSAVLIWETIRRPRIISTPGAKQ